ncbi:MAG: hypothetical protein ACRCVV_20255 [Shewanella sp.]
MRTLLLFSLLFLFSCSDATTDNAPSQTPEQVSLGFFNAVYVDKDIEKAKTFVNEPLQAVLSHYYIASAVQRNVLNLSMNNVEMEIDDINIDFFRKLTKDVLVVVKMKGLKGDSPWIDDRTIRLNKIGNKWIIVEIMPEKRKVNG